MDSTPKARMGWLEAYIMYFLSHFTRWTLLDVCNSFHTLAWNILDEVAAILVGFLCHGNFILFLLMFHMYECFLSLMIHFTL